MDRQFIQTVHPSNTKQFWKSFKILTGNTTPHIPVIEHDNEDLTDDKEKANALNRYILS